jgi:Enoyl-CoA hydratase/isomerase
VAFAHMAAERMPLYVALYLALTGARVTSASDLLALGMATHYVASGDVEQMRKDLLATDFTPCSDNGVTQAVERHTSPFPQPCEDGVQVRLLLSVSVSTIVNCSAAWVHVPVTAVSILFELSSTFMQMLSALIHLYC